MSLDLWLTAQAIIARIGEKSRMGWWETDAYGQASSLVLSRLFPRTGPWAAIQLSISGAAAEHRRRIPAIPAITLFDLGEAMNRKLSDLLLQKKHTQAKLDAPDAWIDELGNPSGEELVAELTQLGFTTPHLVERVQRTAARANRSVCVGDLPHEADWTGAEILGLLIAGYQFSAPGEFVAPYLRVVL